MPTCNNAIFYGSCLRCLCNSDQTKIDQFEIQIDKDPIIYKFVI